MPTAEAGLKVLIIVPTLISRSPTTYLTELPAHEELLREIAHLSGSVEPLRLVPPPTRLLHRSVGLGFSSGVWRI